MKNKILISLGIVFNSVLFNAQEFDIAPAQILSDYELPTTAQSQIMMKVQKAISKNGVSGENATFALVPEVSILSERTSSGIPPVAEIEYDLSFSLQNIFDGKSFASYPFTIKSKGSNKANAIAVGLKNVNLNTSEFQNFLSDAKQKVVSHYEKELPKIIQKANTAMNTKQYEEALFILSQVPEDIPSYPKISALIEKNYKMYEETAGSALLQRAKALWASSKDQYTAGEVADLLSQIPAGTKAHKEATVLINSIDKTMNAREEFAKRMIDKQITNQNRENLARIEAAKAIGVAYGKNSGTKVILYR